MDRKESVQHWPVASPDVPWTGSGESLPITPGHKLPSALNYGSYPYVFGAQTFYGNDTFPYTPVYGGCVSVNYQPIQQPEMGFYWPVHLSTVPFTATSTNELKDAYCKNAENIVPTPFYSPPPDQPDTHAQSMIQSEYPHAMIQNQNPTNSPQRTDSSDLSVMGNSTTLLKLTMPAEQSDPSLPSLDDSDKYCKHCDRYFVSQSGLKHHNKARHAGVRPHRCTKCGKRFSELVLLHRHMLRHAPQNKPHKCEHCPKTFCYRNDLRRHMYLHTGAEPYHCAICAKGFARRDHMQKHELTHQSPKKRPLSMDGDLITNVTIVDHPIP